MKGDLALQATDRHVSFTEVTNDMEIDIGMRFNQLLGYFDEDIVTLVYAHWHILSGNKADIQRIFFKAEKLFFIILLSIHLIPIWAFEFFPSQDGPVHIENASVIRDYYHPERSIYAKYYVFKFEDEDFLVGDIWLEGDEEDTHHDEFAMHVFGEDC